MSQQLQGFDSFLSDSNILTNDELNQFMPVQREEVIQDENFINDDLRFNRNEQTQENPSQLLEPLPLKAARRPVKRSRVPLRDIPVPKARRLVDAPDYEQYQDNPPRSNNARTLDQYRESDRSRVRQNLAMTGANMNDFSDGNASTMVQFTSINGLWFPMCSDCTMMNMKDNGRVLNLGGGFKYVSFAMCGECVAKNHNMKQSFFKDFKLQAREAFKMRQGNNSKASYY